MFLLNLFVICIAISDLLSYYHSLPGYLVVTKNELAELCLSECMFKVAFHPQIMDLLPVISYSLQISELTPQVREYLNLVYHHSSHFIFFYLK